MMEKSAIREGRGMGGIQRLMEKFPFFVDPSLSLSTRLALAGKYFEMREHLLRKFCQKNIGWWCGGPPLVERKAYGEECSACGLVGPSHAQNIFLRG